MTESREDEGKILHGSLSFALSSTGPDRAGKEAMAVISPHPFTMLAHISVSPVHLLLQMPTPNPLNQSLSLHISVLVRSPTDKKARMRFEGMKESIEEGSAPVHFPRSWEEGRGKGRLRPIDRD